MACFCSNISFSELVSVLFLRQHYFGSLLFVIRNVQCSSYTFSVSLSICLRSFYLVFLVCGICAQFFPFNLLKRRLLCNTKAMHLDFLISIRIHQFKRFALSSYFCFHVWILVENSRRRILSSIRISSRWIFCSFISFLCLSCQKK